MNIKCVCVSRYMRVVIKRTFEIYVMIRRGYISTSKPQRWSIIWKTYLCYVTDELCMCEKPGFHARLLIDMFLVNWVVEPIERGHCFFLRLCVCAFYLLSLQLLCYKHQHDILNDLLIIHWWYTFCLQVCSKLIIFIRKDLLIKWILKVFTMNASRYIMCWFILISALY